MNILIVAPPVFPVSSSTGSSVEISIYQIAKRLAQTHQVTIISCKSKRLPAVSKNENLTIVRISGKKNYVQKVIHYAKKHTFDVIQVDNRPRFIPVLRRHFSRIPIVLVLHSLTFMRPLTRVAQENVMRKSSAVICNSRFIRLYYVKRFPHHAKKLHAIHLGVDLSRFKTPTSTQKSQIRVRYSLSGSFVILYAGRIIPGKGVHTLIRAAGLVKKTIPSARVVLVGPSGRSYKARIMREAKMRKIRVLFTGKVKPSSMHKMYWLGDCFVCPTQFHEAFGLVNVEAMSSGLPVIASKRGGIVEIINKKNGILVRDYKNPEAFAREIKRIFHEPGFAKSIAKAGRNTVLDRFGWGGVAAHYKQFYKKNFLNKKSRSN